jgi:hypothetical protein
MKLETGDIILVRVTKFSTWYRWLFAQLIKLFDRSYYHHAVACINGTIHEADKIVTIREASHYDGCRVLILKLRTPLNYREKMNYELIAKNLLGRKYDYWGAIICQLIYRTIGIWIGPTGHASERRPFCSEHVLTFPYLVRGYCPDKYRWSPGDIARKAWPYYELKYEGIFDSTTIEKN